MELAMEQAMELVSEMATPEKVRFMRELVKGSTISIQYHNNQSIKKVCTYTPMLE
jgi:hypothetical protein